MSSGIDNPDALDQSANLHHRVPRKRPRHQQSPSHSPTALGPRPSQRAPKSCLECARRKIRCDKEQPCGPCRDRGAAGECRREAVFVKGAILSGNPAQTAITLESLAKEVDSLRRRVTQLEGPRLTADTSPIRDIDSPPLRQSVSDVDQSKLPGTMEEIALGIGESTRWKGTSLLNNRDGEPTSGNQWYSSVTFETSLSALPSHPNCLVLVTFYLEQVAWLSGAIQGRVFMAELQTFWEQLARNELRDQLWIGLLFAVLSVSALFMDEGQAGDRGLSFQYLKVVGTVWFDSAIGVLFRLGIWTRPSLVACQIIHVLGPAFHLTGHTNLHQTLSALCSAHMRSINLHLLGSPRDDGVEETPRKEIGRRIWWNTVESDWIFIPYNHYVQFPPHQFTTAMPEIFDEGFPTSDGHLTIVYKGACYRSARCTYDVYGHLGPFEEPAYDRVLSASNDLDDIRATLPLELRFDRNREANVAPSTSLPVEVTRRRLLALLLAYRSYQLHRGFFARSLNNAQCAESQRACLEAADTILSVAECGLPSVYFQLWNVTVSLVAAGILLAMHMLETTRLGQPASDRLRIQLVMDRLETLEDPSGIAGRGAIFISHLLRIHHDVSTGHTTKMRYTRDSIMSLVQAGRYTTISHGLATPQVSSQIASLADTSTGLAFDIGPYVQEGGVDFDFTALLSDFLVDP